MSQSNREDTMRDDIDFTIDPPANEILGPESQDSEPFTMKKRKYDVPTTSYVPAQKNFSFCLLCDETVYPRDAYAHIVHCLDRYQCINDLGAYAIVQPTPTLPPVKSAPQTKKRCKNKQSVKVDSIAINSDDDTDDVESPLNRLNYQEDPYKSKKTIGKTITCILNDITKCPLLFEDVKLARGTLKADVPIYNPTRTHQNKENVLFYIGEHVETMLYFSLTREDN
jgi:hypothetical protein